MQDPFGDPNVNPYPEFEGEVFEMYFQQGLPSSRLSGDDEGVRYETWLAGASPIFSDRPEKWGLRGDPFLWDELHKAFAVETLPAQLTAFKQRIYASFEEMTGASLKDDGDLFVERFAHGGMSSGGIHRQTWREQLVPALLRGFRRANRLASKNCLVTESDFCTGLENEMVTNPTFAQWFLSKMGQDGQEVTVVWSRSDNPWTTVVHPSPDGKSVARQGETDVLVVFEGAGGHRLGGHIECKRPGGRFTPHQAKGYPLRAEKWAGKSDYGNYDAWQTVLVAPLVMKEDVQAKLFDHFVPYEEALQRL